MAKKSEKERAEEHGCDGKCYWNNGMCPRVDNCEETRRGEFLATLFAIPTLFGAGLLFIAILCLIATA